MWNKIQETFAEMVIRAYADRDRLTEQECNNLGMPEGNCIALQAVLGPGSGGTITHEEQGELAGGRYPFPKKFIDSLAGTDGKKALRARVKWLADRLDNAGSIIELYQIGPDAKAAVPSLIRTVGSKGKQREARVAAMWALGKIGPDAKNAVPALIEASNNDNNKMRQNAVWSLGKIRSDAEATIPILKKALKDEDAKVRQLAAAALAKFGPAAKSAIDALEYTAKNDPDKDVQDSAKEALKKLKKH